MDFESCEPTLGASYTTTPTGIEGTRLAADISQKTKRLDEWADCAAVVIPMCMGKTTLVDRYGGYDIDDIVVNERPLACDSEYDLVMGNREDGIWHGDKVAMHLHNQLMLKRVARFFSTVRPDSNARVVFVHTVELARALQLRVIAVASVGEEALRATKRLKDLDAHSRSVLVNVSMGQATANAIQCRRHGLDHYKCHTYGELQSRVESALVRYGFVQHTPSAAKLWGSLYTTLTERERLDYCESYLRGNHPQWTKAVAARHIYRSLGEASTQNTHMHHNHVSWAKVVHGCFSARVVDKPEDVSAILNRSEETWRKMFTFGPGNSRFALFDVSSWLDRTPRTELENKYDWFKQLTQVPDVRYERLAATLTIGDVLSYVWPEYERLCYTLPLGALATEDFMEVTQAIHNLVRVGCNFLGVKLKPRALSLFTYWHCLAGRNYAEADMDKEMEDRLNPKGPKYFLLDGRKSEQEFDRRLSEKINKLYDFMSQKRLETMQVLGKGVESFENFLDNRKKWVRSGSATGSPKTDLLIKLPEETSTAIEDIGIDLLSAGTAVLRNLRLNKSATFEFKEFVGIVQQACKDFVPNSFTRHFTKQEVGKPGGRALYPSHMLHYIITSYVLYLVEKGAQVPKSRLLADSMAQVDDHWVWKETREFSNMLMLDYANFNETHEIKHMKEVIYASKTFYSRFHLLSPDMNWAIDWVCSAFDNILFEWEGVLVRFLHGLLSGWRCTSFNNSLKNVAYLELIADQIYDIAKIRVLTDVQTGGDDVAARVDGVYEAAMILRVGEAMGFEFKSIKQLLGEHYSEFFRLMVTQDGVYGSLCRMLGSAVSGQWSNSTVAKFVEPASKLSSVVEIARKAGRRSRLNLAFSEKMCLCAFEKWATFGEVQLAEELIHGTIKSGGLGVPKVNGEVYVLDGKKLETPERLEIIDVPRDASLTVAKEMVEEATKLVGSDCVEDPDRVATVMATSVFKGAIATGRGPGVAQALLSTKDLRQRPVVRRIKNIPREQFATERSARFGLDRQRYKERCDAYRRAGNRYKALVQAVKEGKRLDLARKIAAENTGVEPTKLFNWQENLTVYGCATYLLTEDYYDAVMLLAIVQSEKASDDEVSAIAARYAVGLANDGYMFY
uniref:RNA-directed RNA polymerase n=1 Tax=Macrophomina phaseolina chrysovirus 2 TaxID=2741636 RepID=A0A7S5WLV5_9VIRU|nr:RNA-dependent RNA polymerase [Macrophomina phaseolina chrysovirus 2]